MRFLAVAAVSLAMTTAFGQSSQSGSQSGSSDQGSQGSGQYQQSQKQDKTGTSTQSQSQPGVQQDKSGQGVREGTTTQPGSQSGQSGKSGTQSGTKSGTSTQQERTQGQGMGSVEDRVKSEVSWMKSEFNLDQNQEKKLHDVLLKYEKQAGTTGATGQGASATKNQEEKDKEIKAIIGDQNFQIYKKREAERKQGTTTPTTPTPDRSNP